MENDIWFGTDGPRDAEIVLVGEAWGAEEYNAKKPFQGSAGIELNRILAEAGIRRQDILVTNVVPERPYGNEMWRLFHAHTKESPAPPNTELRGLHPTSRVVDSLSQLRDQIGAFPRRVVIATGNYPLWGLTSHSGYVTTGDSFGRRVPNGIMNWRGSMTYTLDGAPCLPIVHPAAIMRQWENRAVTVHDLKARVPMALRGDWKRFPVPVCWAPPTFSNAVMKLKQWLSLAQAGPLRLAADIETRKGIMTCIGFADSVNFAMCIPWVQKVPNGLDSYWTPTQEATLVGLIRTLLNHPNVWVEGQNFLYDTQYIQHFWGVTPKCDFDTMLAQHLCWPGTPKGLDYISSLYCKYHWYWKEDGKEWDTTGTLEEHLAYNCEDNLRTFEAAEVLRKLIPQLNLSTQWERRQKHRDLALRMMNRGVAIDLERKRRLAVELSEALARIDTRLLRIIPQHWVPEGKSKKRSLWVSSPSQQLYVFGEILGMKIPKNRKTGKASMGKESLEDLRKKNPVWENLFSLLEERRSVAVFKSHFVDAALDFDKRMRCSFNPAGTETFRWNSSANAFNRGTNLQNLPVGDEE